MKYIIFLLLLISPFFTFSQTKCDEKHHILKSIALTYPPCYDCVCGKHLSFDLKTYIALEAKYGDSVDEVVYKYMKDGSWYSGIKLIDSIEVGKKNGAPSLTLSDYSVEQYWGCYDNDTAKSIFHVQWHGRKAVVDRVPDIFQRTDTIVINGRVYIYKKQK